MESFIPNILVLLSDQLRRHALGVHGDPDARTPHMDAFAQKGIRFDNACSTYPICGPFRFTLMTGEYAHISKVPGIEYAMSPAERTLADEFNEQATKPFTSANGISMVGMADWDLPYSAIVLVFPGLARDAGKSGMALNCVTVLLTLAILKMTIPNLKK